MCSLICADPSSLSSLFCVCVFSLGLGRWLQVEDLPTMGTHALSKAYYRKMVHGPMLLLLVCPLSEVWISKDTLVATRSIAIAAIYILCDLVEARVYMFCGLVFT